MFRTKKIGVLGTMNSGKTVLLTSLLWHLYRFSKDRFKIGTKNEAEIKDVTPVYKLGEKDFNFDKYSNVFVSQGAWPSKTTDFSVARCTYRRTDSHWEHDMTFVDIPGERVSDVFIWQAGDFADWTLQIERFWSGDGAIQKCMEKFQKSREQFDNTTDEVPKIWDTLVNEYRNGLIALAGIYSPCITPSTFVLTPEGKTLQGLSMDEIQQVPIWDKGDFFPLPAIWRKGQNKVLRELYAKAEKNFEKYRKEVLKPLYNEIDECDSFIVCVDVFNILMSGASRFYQVQKEINSFFTMIKPSAFGEMLIGVQRAMDVIKLDKILPNGMQARPPKIAYVATKSDMAIPSSQKNRLHKLLQDLVQNIHNSSYVNSRLFTCSAGKTFEFDPSSNSVVYYSAKGQVHAPIATWPELPQSWMRWQPVLYRGFGRQGLPMQDVIGVPPEQDNLDKLFDFITEDEI